MLRPSISGSLILMFALSQTHAKSPDCFVNASAAPGGDGKSWVTAYKDLQTALTNLGCIETWVAKGVYKPTTTTDQTISFNVKPAMRVYGGFAGNEFVVDARDPKKNVTVLSGDIDDNDANAGGSEIDETAADARGSNSYHVVRMDGNLGSPIIATTVLDGFTITGGYAFGHLGGDLKNFYGGGLYCDGAGTGNLCSPALHSITFSGNSAEDDGGAMYNDGSDNGNSSPTLTDIVFHGNSVGGCGGAISNFGFKGVSEPMLANVTFDSNDAFVGGGAMCNLGKAGSSNPTLVNVAFIDNGTDGEGGAMYNNGEESGISNPTLLGAMFAGNNASESGGAIFNEGYRGSSNPVLTNVTINHNSAGRGGAIYNDAYDSGSSSPTLINVTLSGNNAERGGAIYNDGTSSGVSHPLLLNTVLWGNNATTDGAQIYNDTAISDIDHSIVEGGCPVGSSCTNMVTGDPLLSPLSDHGGFTWTMMPSESSPAIDTGDDASCPSTDQRGITRPQGAHCDIGAVERQSMEDIIFKDGFQSF